uniref:Protein SYS1 homolog n=1 Tax=Steinernema glaseri TaxID=37863 RepID=A0A1I8A4W2_9BILA
MVTVFYSVQCFLMTLLGYVATFQPSIHYIFTAQVFRPMMVIQLLTSLATAFALSVVVQRAKQCLDFVCTIHFWHLLAVICYARAFPTQISWWLLQLICIVISTVLGEYLCMRVETREIPLSTNPRMEV